LAARATASRAAADNAAAVPAAEPALADPAELHCEIAAAPREAATRAMAATRAATRMPLPIVQLSLLLQLTQKESGCSCSDYLCSSLQTKTDTAREAATRATSSRTMG
jgi:hypothetical protein